MDNANGMQKLVDKMFAKKDILEVNKMTFAVVMGKAGKRILAVIVADDDAIEFFEGERVEKIKPRLGFKLDKNKEGLGLDVTLSVDFDEFKYDSLISGKFKKYQTGVLEGLKTCDKVGIAIVNNKKKLIRPMLVNWDVNSAVKMI